MVERQGWDIVDAEPLGSGGIVATGHFLDWHHTIIGYANHSLSWVTVGRGESVELLEVIDLKARFLL